MLLCWTIVNGCQPSPAFLHIFTKMSWPPEYFVVLISEHAVHQNKDQTLYFQTKNCYILSFMHCFLTLECK